MRTLETTCSFSQPEYPVGVVLTLPREGSVLGRLGIGVQTRAIPRLGTGVTLPTQYYNHYSCFSYELSHGLSFIKI